ncbi:MAG: putative formate hydrogenlyase, subunit 7 [Rhodocyclaceae bacterium]|nr:putative formate hydrogenlyase, subunit 7 [Rhodocyclaceae bacterium]
MWKLVKQIVRTGVVTEPAPVPPDDCRQEAERIQREILQTLGKALTIREVDAGSCNGCELEIHAVNNPYYNLEGLGIKFVASPRHADMLLVTGPVSRNMAVALKRTYDATPAPKLVVAVGDCGCDGGIFGESYACVGSVSRVIPVDRVVPGCPPEPIEILRAILATVRAGYRQKDEPAPEVSVSP